MDIKQVAVDLSNYCSKTCPFCYNQSSKAGGTSWKADEVLSFCLDCHRHGVEAVSLGGGEPLEYGDLFAVIDGLRDELYVTVTTNGLRLDDAAFFSSFVSHLPDKLHLSLHHPTRPEEMERILRQVHRLEPYEVNVGVNLLVSVHTLEPAGEVYRRLLREKVSPDRIILVPMKPNETPTGLQLAEMTGGRPFQAPSCLQGCRKPQFFCSVSWDKKANWCGYAPGKVPLSSLNWKGLVDALGQVDFRTCHEA